MTSSTATRMQDLPHRRPALAFPALLSANMLLASASWFVRVADTGPIATGFWRLALALPLLLLLAAVNNRGTPRPSRRVVLTIVVGGLFFAADLASWHLGIVHTKLANATLFGNSSSLILPLAAIAVTGIWPTHRQWTALALALAGALMLMGSSYELAGDYLIGDLLCLLAGILYVGFLLSIHSARRALPSWWVLALSTAASAPLVLAFAWIAGERIIPGNWGPVLVLALTCQVLGQGMMVYAIAHFSPLIVGLALLTQPATAALIGWIAFGEQLSTLDIAGTVIVAVALVLIQLPERARRSAAPSADGTDPVGTGAVEPHARGTDS